MSDITSSYGKSSIYGGVIVDIAEENLPKTLEMLAGFGEKAYRAVGSALKRAAESGKTVAKTAVTKEYAISASEFLRSTRNINTIVHETGGSLSVEFGYAGYVIPLLRFNTRVGQDGRVYTQVKRSSTQAALDHAFVAQMGGHKGVYERIGQDRYPVRELYGPATTQMMNNEDVLDNIEEKVVETYEKRIDHEILRVLNGWGR